MGRNVQQMRLRTAHTTTDLAELRLQIAGTVLRVTQPRRTGGNHHHVVCGVCVAIGDVDCRDGAGPCHLPGVDHGFTVQSTDVTYWGLCEHCNS